MNIMMKVEAQKSQNKISFESGCHSQRISCLRKKVLLLCLPLLMMSCNRMEELFHHETPRESYISSMEKSPLRGKRLWENWKIQGDSVWKQAISAKIAMEQILIYFMDIPDAWAWKIYLPAGRQLKIICSPADTSQRIFTDLFILKDGVPVPEASTEDTLMEYASHQDQELILRIQPEFLIEGRARLRITDAPQLSFPVQGGRRYDIGSFWGDPRDAGGRRHEGVDIFAARNTPALAVGEGRIIRTGEGGLGGKTVWLRSGGLSLYYAHLDSIAVSFGSYVKEGDTVGFVGNTGNARTTPPHLHFGIYRQGAIDPLPFIDVPNFQFPSVSIDFQGGQKWGRISGKEVNVRLTPSTKEAPVTTLHRNQVIHFRGGIEDWYQIRLPDGRPGYIHRSLMKVAAEPLSQEAVDEKDTLYYRYQSDRFFLPVDTFQQQIEEYGYFGKRALIRYGKQWVWKRRDEI